MTIEKELSIVYDGAEKIVKLHEISYGKYNQIMQQCTKLEIAGTTNLANIDFWKMRRAILEASLVDKIDLEKVGMQDGQKLETLAMKINGLEENVAGDASFQSKV